MKQLRINDKKPALISDGIPSLLNVLAGIDRATLDDPEEKVLHGIEELSHKFNFDLDDAKRIKHLYFEHYKTKWTRLL